MNRRELVQGFGVLTAKSDVDEILKAFPRLGFKVAFVETCAEVVRKHPEARRAASRVTSQNGMYRIFTRTILAICSPRLLTPTDGKTYKERWVALSVRVTPITWSFLWNKNQSSRSPIETL